MAQALAKWMRGFQRDRRKSTQGFVRSMYHKPQAEDYLRRVTEASLATPTNSAALLIHNMDREDWTPVLAKLAEAKTPVLATFTAQEMKTVDLLRAKVPAAQVVIFEDAGHALFVDDAERFNTVVQQFIEGIRAK
jgi:microsomal epoxide hydrolase